MRHDAGGPRTLLATHPTQIQSEKSGKSVLLTIIEGLGKMLIVQSLILFARWYTKMLLMTVGD
jgi:hypothetical protein